MPRSNPNQRARSAQRASIRVRGPRQVLATHGHQLLRRALQPVAARRLAVEVAASIRQFGVAADELVPGSPARFADPLTEALLGRLQSKVERIAGVRLLPTYSYARVYQRGAVLAAHTDRAPCEFSVSLNLACRPAAPWPLWLEGPRGCAAIKLMPGDAVVYLGIDCPHWREAFAGTECVQVFLHYVAADGKHAEWGRRAR